MTKLQFHPQILEFIESVDNENADKVIEELQALFDAGVEEINIFLTGEGDNGNEILFNYYANSRDLLPNLPVKHLEDFVWAAASATTPGYEINNGGGYDVILEFREDGRVSFRGEGYYNERSSAWSLTIEEDDYDYDGQVAEDA